MAMQNLLVDVRYTLLHALIHAQIHVCGHARRHAMDGHVMIHHASPGAQDTHSAPVSLLLVPSLMVTPNIFFFYFYHFLLFLIENTIFSKVEIYFSGTAILMDLRLKF